MNVRVQPCLITFLKLIQMKTWKIFISLFSVGLLLTAFYFPSVSLPHNQFIAPDSKDTIIILSEKQVGKDGASTKFSYFSTSPESPDGKKIIYLRLKVEPIGMKRSALVPGELWICDHDLTEHRKVTDIKGMSSEDGCLQQWLDNNHVALQDSGIIRVIDVRNGKDILKRRVATRFLGHDSFDGKVLFTVGEPQTKSKHGIYELNCFTGETRPVILNVNCRGFQLPSYLDAAKILPVEYWRMLHCQYSPDGKKICFRVDAGKGDRYQLLGVCNIDGSDFELLTKPLHQMWYNNESFMGHARFDENGNSYPSEKKFELMRWDLNGKYIETLGPKGNHLGASPDLKYFASETMYYKSPVILKLYPKGQSDKAIEIANFDPFDITWNRFFHVNPAFSRDGKRLYYCKPLNEKYSGTFVCELKYK